MDDAIWSARISELWQQHHCRAFDVAYRLLGSVDDADDAVQEAYLRLSSAELEQIDDVRGWLVTVTSRLCLDRLRAHERLRRAYVGPWLPEPIVEQPAGGADPADRATLDESVRMALLVVLEELSPAERTSFVLHDVFGLPFDEIGQIVGRRAGACRQLASRARRRIGASPARFNVDSREHDAVVRRFAAACQRGDLEGLVRVLDTDVVGDFDSGGQVAGAPLGALDGADRVARQLLGVLARRGARFEVASVNGQTGIVVRIADAVAAVISLVVVDGHVVVVHGVGNPDKLNHIDP